ncbi:MAG: hypothetical protein WCG36_08875 [bacterium]
MTQLCLLEWTPPRAVPQASEQSRQLARVEGRIAEWVISFCMEHVGREFYASELAGFVCEQSGGSPESGMRVLRALRRTGQVDVELVSRSASLYRVVGVSRAAAGLDDAGT